MELDKTRIRFMGDIEEITREFNEGKIHWTNNWEPSLLHDYSKIVFNPLFEVSRLIPPPAE
ncbi:hypothetical protein ES703_74555 [subsurface metagenome]